MKPKHLLLLIACLLFLASRPSSAEDAITIKADTMSHSETDQIINADGNVVMVWGDMTVTARRATYNRMTGQMTVYEDVTMKKGDDTLRGEWATLDMTTGRGEVYRATASRKDSNATLTGDSIIRKEDGTLLLRNTDLTTCERPDPSWKFGAGRLDVDPEGYAVGRDILFYVMDVPVLYIPWFAFPASKERTSGLLFPKIGHSSKRGFQLDIPFYWVISPSQEATIDLDVLSERGVGVGVDYSYLRSRDSWGEIAGYQIYDLKEDRWRGQVTQKHTEVFSPDLNLRTSVNLSSDRNFHKDFGEKTGEYNSRASESVVNLLKTWQQYALTGTLRYGVDYYADNNDDTLQTLPEIGLSAVRQEFFATPFYFDLDSSASNFYRENGPSGQRLHVFPRLSMVSGLSGYLNVSAYAGLHMRAYNTYDIPAGSDTGDSSGNLIPETGLTVSAPFSRLFDIDGEQLTRLRHELIPEVSYRYAPRRDQSRLPMYDYDDRLIHQNVVYYGVTSLLSGKFKRGETTEYRALSRVRLMQGYSFEGTRRDLLTMADDSHDTSDIILESETWLHPNLKLLFDARYNLHDDRLASANPGVEFDDRHGSSASVSYRMTRNSTTAANRVEYLEAHLGTRRFTPWIFDYSTRYSFDRSAFLESVYAVEYRYQCWSVNFAYRDRKGNPSFTFNFNLAGLAESGLKGK